MTEKLLLIDDGSIEIRDCVNGVCVRLSSIKTPFTVKFILKLLNYF